MTSQKGYTYKVVPSPYWLLGKEERRSILKAFKKFVSLFDEDLCIIVRSKKDFVETEDDKIEVSKMEYYVCTKTEIFAPEIDIIPTDSLKRPKIKDVHRGFCVLDNGLYVRSFVLSGFADEVSELPLHDIQKISGEIILKIRPLPSDKSKEYIERAIRVFDSILKSQRRESLDVKISRLRNSLKSYNSRLYSILLIVNIMGKSIEELQKKVKEFESLSKNLGLIFVSPPSLQKELYEGMEFCYIGSLKLRLISRLIVDSKTLGLLYPFASDSINDPGGIFLGINPENRMPIFFNVYTRRNYNMVIIGESGSGKSITAKVYVKRMFEKFRPEIYIIDPEGEYSSDTFRNAIDARVIKIDENARLGADLIRLKSKGVLSPLVVFDIIKELYEIPKDVEHELRRCIYVSRDLSSFKKELSPKLREYLSGMDVPPDVNFYTGNPLRFRERTIFDLSEIKDHRTKMLSLALIIALLTEKMIISKPSPKILVVDEGWIFSEYPSMAAFLTNVARRGRKRLLNLVFITQRPSDLYSTNLGRTIIEQSETSIIMRLEESSLEILSKIYSLKEAEKEFILEAEPGIGVLRVGNVKVPIKVVAPNRFLM